MRYEGDIYRPPSEARSLIVQVTVGCAHNTCTFCTMYKAKQFRVRPQAEILEDLAGAAADYGDLVRKIFLADGDALIVQTDRLLEILDFCRERFPVLERVTAYATAQDILRKTDEELAALRAHGLEMVYVGAESGDPQILTDIRKDVTCEELIEAAAKAKRAGIAVSLTLISGLGGKARLAEHAVKSAELVSAMKPEYLGFLTLMLDPAAPIMKEIREGRLKLLEPADVAEEMRLFLSNVDSEGTVFRANHASNYITLKGTLNRDIPEMLTYLDRVRAQGAYRPEGWRRL